MSAFVILSMALLGVVLVSGEPPVVQSSSYVLPSPSYQDYSGQNNYQQQQGYGGAPQEQYQVYQEYAAPQVHAAPLVHYSQYSPYTSSPNAAYADDGSAALVDEALLGKVVQLLEQNESAQQQYSTSYGAPGKSSGRIILERPEKAQKVAEFDLTDHQSSGGYATGGYY